MNVGDLVRVVHRICVSRDSLGSQTGIVVAIDPLREELKSRGVNVSFTACVINEIVVMLPDGKMWYSNPRDWECLVDSH